MEVEAGICVAGTGLGVFGAVEGARAGDVPIGIAEGNVVSTGDGVLIGIMAGSAAGMVDGTSGIRLGA